MSTESAIARERFHLTHCLQGTCLPPSFWFHKNATVLSTPVTNLPNKATQISWELRIQHTKHSLRDFCRGSGTSTKVNMLWFSKYHSRNKVNYLNEFAVLWPAILPGTLTISKFTSINHTILIIKILCLEKKISTPEERTYFWVTI